MKFQFSEKKVKLPGNVHAYAEKKVMKLGRYFDEEAEALIKRLSEYENLSPVGLMTMGPAIDAEEIRPYFKETKRLFDELSSKGLLGTSPVLSMGMSDSYRVAIEEGSDIVRVGRRLFIK